MTCTHTSFRMVKGSYNEWDDSYDPDYSESYSTTEDVDLHRFRCTQCNLMMYYSGRARDYYEKGIKSHVKGLDK